MFVFLSSLAASVAAPVALPAADAPPEAMVHPAEEPASAVAASPSPSGRCLPSDDVRASPTMPAVRALTRMHAAPSPRRDVAKQAEQRALARARAVAADPGGRAPAIEAAFAELGAARALLARVDAEQLGQLMAQLPAQDRCTLLMLLPSVL